jgi:uncharacterized membrane protein
MLDILPNWHPAVVHFPIALTLTATGLLLAGQLRVQSDRLLSCARLLLPLAAVSALIAAGMGWQAFATVEHDAAGHLVMLRHRNWALASSLALLAIVLVDAWRQRNGKAPGPALAVAMLAVSGGLGMTGWLGGEMVYRHGVGVSASAFAMPTPPPEPPALLPEAATPQEIKPPAVHGEHVHKDGKRHHH